MYFVKKSFSLDYPAHMNDTDYNEAIQTSGKNPLRFHIVASILAETPAESVSPVLFIQVWFKWMWQHDIHNTVRLALWKRNPIRYEESAGLFSNGIHGMNMVLVSLG